MTGLATGEDGVLRRSTILLAVLGAIAVGLPVLGYFMAADARSSADEASEARFAFYGVAIGALNAQTGQRGYILTGDEDFLGPYVSGLFAFELAVNGYRAHTDDRAALDRLDVLVASFSAWREEVAGPQITLVREGKAEEARTALREGGQRRFDEVRNRLGELEPRTVELLAGAESDEVNAAHLQVALTAGGAIALATFVVVGIGTLSHGHRTTRALGAAMGRLGLSETELESERRLSGQRGEIIATAAHDLRNPLTGLLLSAQMLEAEASQDGNPELSELAGEVVLSARRAADMVTELLDFTRLEAGVLRLDAQPMAATTVVESAVEDVRSSHRGIQIAVEDERALAPPAPLTGDFVRLRMVVRNLLENGYRYGEPPLRVRIAYGARSCEFHVEDSGEGVSAGEEDSIFERFQRGSRGAGTEGTGIGLYVSRGIVELHGGSISVGRSPLGGADFVVSLPRSS